MRPREVPSETTLLHPVPSRRVYIPFPSCTPDVAVLAAVNILFCMLDDSKSVSEVQYDEMEENHCELIEALRCA